MPKCKHNEHILAEQSPKSRALADVTPDYYRDAPLLVFLICVIIA